MARRKTSLAESLAEPALVPLVPPSCTWPIALGIDPGTRVLGYGAVVRAPKGPVLLATGVLRAARDGSIEARLAELWAGLERILALCRPTVIVIERAFAAQNVQSALRIGESRGMALTLAGRARLRVLEIAPAAAKKAVTGNGQASKQQVAALVSRLMAMPVEQLPLDATDALALALAGLMRIEKEARIGTVLRSDGRAARALAAALAPAAQAAARRSTRATLLKRSSGARLRS